MLRSLVVKWLNYRARKALHRACIANIAASARIDYRRMGRRLPASLSVGANSIVHVMISADRGGAAVSIGANSFVGPSHFVCAERITVGDDVLISWGCTIVDHDAHAVAWEDRANDVREYYHGRKDWTRVRIAPVRICDKAWVGFNATILRGVTIGEGAVVGCGSVVTKDVPAYSVVAGNPARIVKKIRDEG
jgi:acetyltransferase-like isoleucine patch superfamily enzyme